MIKLIGVMLALLTGAFTLAQQAPARLIVRGDDMGCTHAENAAIIQCFVSGIVTSAEVIVVSPWFPEAVKLLQQHPGLDVGVHLTITSEWDNLKWRPLTSCKSLIDSNGYFFPRVQHDKNQIGQAISENQWDLLEIEQELRAQILLAQKNIPHVSHLTLHMNFSKLSSSVAQLVQNLAKEYHIHIDPSDHQLISVGYNGPSKTSEEKLTSFLKMLKELEPGKTYLFVDHPGYDNEEMRAMYHKGYENVASDRQGVTDVFTNKRVKDFIHEHEIALIGYNDLLKTEK
jgi:predicted glycoside hydrolase/deacetylase ChbG (UPF0249 family)